jgi:hypothetical protein
MSSNFQRVSRSLQRDSSLETNLHLLTGILLLTCWLIWALQARVARYEMSDSAHLEVDPVRPHKLKLIAAFEPYAALTELRKGQAAVLRLKALPGAQYQTVPAHVSRICQEIQGGKVRVELAIDSLASPPSFLQAALPGSVTVDVEHISPAALILRSAGALVGAN